MSKVRTEAAGVVILLLIIAAICLSGAGTDGWYRPLQDASDVDKTSPTDGQVLAWDSVLQLWVPSAPSAGSQTPWTQNINGSTYNLTTTGWIKAQNFSGNWTGVAIPDPYIANSSTWNNHTANTTIHVTAQNKTDWEAKSKGFVVYNITNTTDFVFDISDATYNIAKVYLFCNGGTNVTGRLEKRDINGTFLAAVNNTTWVAVNNTGQWINSFENATYTDNETLYWNTTAEIGLPPFFTVKVYWGK